MAPVLVTAGLLLCTTHSGAGLANAQGAAFAPAVKGPSRPPCWLSSGHDRSVPMTAAAPTSASTAAIAAFLRGTERRAAEAQPRFRARG